MPVMRPALRTVGQSEQELVDFRHAVVVVDGWVVRVAGRRGLQVHGGADVGGLGGAGDDSVCVAVWGWCVAAPCENGARGLGRTGWRSPPPKSPGAEPTPPAADTKAPAGR